MTSSAAPHPVVGVVVAPDDDAPPGLDELPAGEVHVVRTADELESVVDQLDVLAVYDFRSRLVHGLGSRAADIGWIHAASAGTDSVLAPAVVDGPVTVTNAQGVFDRPIAEWILTVLLAFAKDLPGTLEHQRHHRWAHRETDAFAGRRALVVGAGSIGRTFARLGRATGLTVTGVARRARPDDPDFDAVVATDDLHDALGAADDVVVCLPLTSSTHHLFDGGAFDAMPAGTRFVNIGRGPVVDETALLAALRSGQVGAAALDVFEEEPLPTDHPFWDLPNVIVSPHMSGDEHGWRGQLTRQFAENLGRWQRGEQLEHVVDKAAMATSPAGGAA